MNLKKVGGGGSSNWGEMVKVARAHNAFLLRQIEIINPGIIILGLSWGELIEELIKDVEWKKSGHGIFICKWKGCRVINFYHPSARNAPSAAYALLEKVISSESFKG